MSAPKPYFQDKNKIKAFVLGCDPTAFDKNGNPLAFEYVFDLGKDKRYFKGVLDNLELINLKLEDIYVQNLLTDYQEKETSKNSAWKQTALIYIEARKEEFDKIDPSGQYPVFLTSEVLYKVLINEDQKDHKAKEFYTNKDLVPIAAEANKLGRPLIPLYRHWDYKLDKYPAYCDLLVSYLEK